MALTSPKHLDDRRIERLASVFKALGDSARLRLLHALLGGEQCVHELTESLDIEQSALSHQLRMLRDLQLVRRRREGRHAYYSLDDAHVRSLLEQAFEHIEHTAAAPQGRGGRL